MRASLWLVIGMMALTGAVAMGGSKEATGDGSSTFARPEWQELEYVARKFLLKATATVSAAYPPVESVSLQPLPEAGDAIQPTGSSVVRVTMLSDLPFGQNEEVVTWLDGDSLAVLEATKLVTGRKHYRKLWRYRSAGYTRWRWEPEGSDDESDPDSWSDLDVKRVSVDAASSGSAPVTDSYALIWLISAARLDRDGATLRAELYADEQLETIELTAAERRPHTVKLTEVRGDETIERDNEIWVRRVVGRPADPGVDVGFFGMKGELTVLVEEGTGVPVEIEGTADGIGHLRVRLKRVVY